MDSAELLFQQELLTTIAELTPSKDALAPIHAELFDDVYPSEVKLAPSSLALFDHMTDLKDRPRLTSRPSSTWSVPSLSSGPSTSSSLSTVLSPGLYADDLSPLAQSSSPLEPGLFAAMQNAFLDERYATKRSSGSSLPSSPVGTKSLLQSSPCGGKARVNKMRRATTLSPRAQPASPSRQSRPPPLDLSGLANGAGRACPSGSTTATAIAPCPQLLPVQHSQSSEELNRVMWEVDSLIAQGQTSAPAYVPTASTSRSAQVPHFTISGMSLGLHDLEMLGSSVAGSAAPTSLWHSPLDDVAVMPASAPAFDMADPFMVHSGSLPPQAFYSAPGIASAGPSYYSSGPYAQQCGPEMLVPLPHRPRSAPVAGNFDCARRPAMPLRSVHRKTSFVNFSVKDANKLLNGVAPSGSSKRKREEEEAKRAGKRRTVSA